MRAWVYPPHWMKLMTTGSRCCPGYPELSKSYLDVSSKFFTLTFTSTPRQQETAHMTREFPCLQVPPYEGRARAGRHRPKRIPQILPNEDQLWHLICVLDRAALTSFFLLCDRQHENERGRESHLILDTTIQTDSSSHERVHAAEDFSPYPYGRKSQQCWGGNSGLFKLHDVFPGVQKILHLCFKSSERVRFLQGSFHLHLSGFQSFIQTCLSQLSNV